MGANLARRLKDCGFPVTVVQDRRPAGQHTGHGTNPERQEGPHAHSVNLSPDNRFAVAADLGLDELIVYRFDATKGSLTANEPPFANVNPGVPHARWSQATERMIDSGERRPTLLYNGYGKIVADLYQS